jgi:hypothetical protein
MYLRIFQIRREQDRGSRRGDRRGSLGVGRVVRGLRRSETKRVEGCMSSDFVYIPLYQ